MKGLFEVLVPRKRSRLISKQYTEDLYVSVLEEFLPLILSVCVSLLSSFKFRNINLIWSYISYASKHYVEKACFQHHSLHLGHLMLQAVVNCLFPQTALNLMQAFYIRHQHHLVLNVQGTAAALQCLLDREHIFSSLLDSAYFH